MIIAFASPKGGEGKSTLALLFAIWLSLQGLRTILIDADNQRSSSKNNRRMKTPVPLRRETDTDKLIDLMLACRQTYDAVVVDGPGGNPEKTRGLLGVTDVAVFPLGASVTDTDAFQDALKVLTSARKIRRTALPHAVVIPNKLVENTIGKREQRAFCNRVEKAGIHVTRRGIIFRQDYQRYPKKRRPVWEKGTEEAKIEITEVFEELLEYARRECGSGQRSATGGNSRRRTAQST